MDFVADNLFNGRRIRALTVVDNYSWETLVIHVDQAIKGQDVVNVMERLRLFEGRCPERIQVDNGRFRDECLNVHWFLSLDDSRKKD